jgi:hypothetical protein|eukprot:SAG25_NODE_468_length_7680_cov_92.421185_1_plen_86_part_00
MNTATPYALEPEFHGKFKASTARDVLHLVLREKLEGKDFNADLTTQWTKEIADEIKSRLKGVRLCIYCTTRVLSAEACRHGHRKV